jgi:hypothetical protein
MSEPLVATEWRRFAEALLPAGTPAVQRTEMRRAFYAGAISLFHMLVTGVSAGDEPKEADLAMMDGIQAEFLQYEADLVAGLA